MAIFSHNDVTQLYVATKIECPVPDTAKPGTLGVKHTKRYMYMDYMGAGGPTRSDLITLDNIEYINAVPSAKMRHGLRRVKVTIDPACTLKECEDYLLRLSIKEYGALSEEHVMDKYGAAHTDKTPTAEEILKSIALGLANSFTGMQEKLVKVYTDDSDTADAVGTLTEVKPGAKNITTTVKGIVIEEVEAHWQLGLFRQYPLNFTVSTVHSKHSTSCSCQWGVIKDVAPANFVENGKKTADREYHYMGARGDYYKMIGYPRVAHTTYLVNPNYKYDYIVIHHSFVGNDTSVQKSEKDTIIVLPDDGSHTLANELIALLNTATANKFNLQNLV